MVSVLVVVDSLSRHYTCTKGLIDNHSQLREMDITQNWFTAIPLCLRIDNQGHIIHFRPTLGEQ